MPDLEAFPSEGRDFGGRHPGGMRSEMDFPIPEFFVDQKNGIPVEPLVTRLI